MQRALLFSFIAIFLISCYDTDLDSLDVVSDNKVNYISGVLDPNAYSNDPYRIIAVTPGDNLWNVIVEYSGGCGDHLFYIWLDVQSQVNDTSEIDLYFIHNGNDDRCEALIRDTIRFDIRQALQFKEFGDDLIVNIKNQTRSQSISVDPSLASLTTTSCNLSASVINTECDFGVYGSIWLQSNEEFKNHGKVLLQPVRSSQDSAIFRMNGRNVDVRITALFGFEYTASQNSKPSCVSSNTATIVPVALHCIELQ